MAAIAGTARPGPAGNHEIVARWLTLPLRALFDGMSRHDRDHAVRVARHLLADGGSAPSTDLVTAALLHDVAKGGTPAVRSRVGLPERTAKVLLTRLAPGLLATLTQRPVLPALYLAVHHARLGAELVHDAGGSERACWLIAAHEDDDYDDPDLRRLVAADAASI